MAVCLLPACVATPAVAQEDGVHYDPDSPAGKEYAIPLQEARRVGGNDDAQVAPPSGTGSGGSGGADETLFGAGVTAAAGDGKDRPGRRKDKDRPDSRTDDSVAVPDTQAPAERAPRSVVADSDSRQLRLGAILAVVAVMAAAGGGLAARRGRRTAA